jgi:hypothetical protein
MQHWTMSFSEGISTSVARLVALLAVAGLVLEKVLVVVAEVLLLLLLLEELVVVVVLLVLVLAEAWARSAAMT